MSSPHIEQESKPSGVDPVWQLGLIIKDWYPKDRIEILGVIIDYCQRTNKCLYNVLIENERIYTEIFENKRVENYKCLCTVLYSDEYPDEKANKVYKERFVKVFEELIDTSKFETPPQMSIEMVVNDAIKDSVIIWQLSDIHFGKLNTFNNNDAELASKLAYPVGMNPKVKPDYIIVSGDISSIAAAKEFNQFKKFIKRLSLSIWEEEQPQRIIMVPGNHEVHWGKNGSADKLTRFKYHFSDDKCCITPFGKESVVFKGPNVEVKRYGLNCDDCPPFAEVTLKDVGINLILLVSSFSSGQISKEMKKLLIMTSTPSDDSENLLDLLRSDSGLTSSEYIALLAMKFLPNDLVNVALMHHHPVTYGSEYSANRNGFNLIDTLWKKNCRLLLHGHIHMFEDARKQTRSAVKGQAFPVPSSTLSSHTAARSKGFLVHAFQKSNPKKLTTLRWEVSSEGNFAEEFLQPLYDIDLSQDIVARMIKGKEDSLNIVR
jgi:UDP-2,3-diacylglucosamine pyrophosphatase LpxH